MRISIKHIGAINCIGGQASNIIEMTVTVDNTTITFDATNLHSLVDEELISELRETADILEQQNLLIKHKITEE